MSVSKGGCHGTWECTIEHFSWNRRLVRHVKAKQHEKTVKFFQQMQQKGMSPDIFTFILVLNGCACSEALKDGWQAHEEIIQSGCEADPFVGE
jgi:pentatricopeptide repeat protein